ncbi:MAG: alcohol dehydrogenase catalytic domain-containing protein [Tissierellaceae bacterium]
MKAAMLYGIEDMRIEEMEIPKCGDDYLIVELKKATLCPTDLKKYYGDKDDVEVGLRDEGPYILGHEAAGIVIESGKNIKNIQVGDRVAIQPMISCGQCHYCKIGKKNMCLNILGVGGSAGNFGDCIRLMNDEGIGGCFATHLKLPEQCVIKLPEEIDYEAGSLIEPLADVIHSINELGVDENDTVVIIGLGPMGLFHTIVASYHKAKRIICIDIDDERLKLSGKLGADIILNSSKEDVVQGVLALTNKIGADKIFVTAGGKAQKTCVEQALAMVAKKGKISLFASADINNDEMTISLNEIHYKMITLTGTVGFEDKHAEEAIEILKNKYFDYKLIRNKEYPLDQIVDGIKDYGKGKNIKVGLDLSK